MSFSIYYLEYCLLLDSGLASAGGNDHLSHVEKTRLGLTLLAAVLVNTQLPNQLAVKEKILVYLCMSLSRIGK